MSSLLRDPASPFLPSLGLLALASVASAQSEPLFLGPHYKLFSQTPFHTQPYAGALGDIDGDGRLDHAATMYMMEGSVALSFGDGQGGFEPPQYVAAGHTPTGIVLQDVNGDAHPDLVVGNSNQSTGNSVLSIHLGLGGGAFGAPASYALDGYGGFELRPLDLNLDGHVDLAVSMMAPIHLTWRFLLGDGAGAFALASGTPHTGTLIALGDVDGDSDTDLLDVAGTGQSFLRLWLNDGAGTLVDMGVAAAFTTIPFASGLGAGDLDGDGDLDAVLIGHNGSVVEVALGDGAGAFAAPVPWPAGQVAGASSPAVLDVTGDGRADVVASRQDNVVVIPGDGAGGFGAAVNYFVGDQPSGPTVGDLNGDGLPDVSVVSMSLYAVALLLSQGPGAYPKPSSEPLGAAPGVVQLADLNGDAHRDVIALTETGTPFTPGFPGLATALGDGLGGFGAPTAYTPALRTVSALLADWNGDFDIDALLAQTTPSTSALELWEGDGQGGLAPVATFTAVAGPIGDARGEDLDGDGRRDVVVAPDTLTGSIPVTWIPGDGLGGFGPPVPVLPCDSNGCARKVWLIDLNADGKRDLVVYTTGIGIFVAPALKSYLGDGAGGFTPAFQAMLFGDFELADVSGDGAPDLVSMSQNNSLAVSLGLGNGAFGPSTSYPYYTSGDLLNGSAQIELGDLDSDGDLDVATNASFHGTAYVYLGDGSGALLRDRGYAARSGASTAIGDVDEDGQADLVAADANGQAVTVLENLTPCGGTVQSYGLGCPGTSGFVPELSVYGCPEPGKQLTIRLQGGLGGSVGFLLLGLVPAHIPVPGACELLIGQILPAVTTLPLSAGAAGTGAHSLTLTIPPVGPSGADLALQAFVLDPVAAYSLSGTNGVRLVIP